MSHDASRVKELQASLEVKMAAQRDLAAAFTIEDNVVQVSADQKAAFDRNMADIKEIKGLIDGLQELKSLEEWGSQAASESVAMATEAKVASTPAPAPYRTKTLGQAFLESDEFKALNGGRTSATMATPFQVKTEDILGYGVKDVYSAMPTGTPGSFGRIERDAIVIPPMRKHRVRDLFPARGTSAAMVEYFKLTGFTNNAATVAERQGDNLNFAAKPQSALTFKGEQAPVRTIAHWEAAHRNVLADEPQLRAIIDNELLYGLRLEEDSQILNGDGTGENLTGLLQTTGRQTYSWSAGVTGDNKADALRRAATLAFLAYYEPTGIVLNPNDWEDIELTKNGQGSYLAAVSIQMGAEARIWRLPVVDTPAIAGGKALVGAFGTAAQIYDRDSASIRVSEQHADFFVRNAIVVLAEQRLALAVKRPESFVEVTFDSAPA